MTVNLSRKDYKQLLDATGGHPDQVFQPGTEIMHEGGLMPHAADCTIHAGKRCGTLHLPPLLERVQARLGWLF